MKISRTLCRVTAASLAISVAAFSSSDSVASEGWLLRRSPVVAIGGAVAITAAGLNAIRDTIPIVIASWNRRVDPTLFEKLRGELAAHRFLGPGAAADTAARLVKLHPELRNNAVAVLQEVGVPLDKFETRLKALERGETAVDTDQSETEDRCPPPTPARESMSARAAAYQKQITDLPPGMVIFLGGVKFDGCRKSDGTLLEAKGQAYAEFLQSAYAKKPWYTKDEDVMDQARRQARVATVEGRKLEWHFAEKLASQYYANRFKLDEAAKMIVVIYDPPLSLKLDGADGSVD